MFELNDFYPFGFLGYIVIICYFIFIARCRKKKIHGFEFSLFVFLIYFCFILNMLLGLRTSITCPNQFWYIPFLICLCVESASYYLQHNKKLIIKRYNDIKQKTKCYIKKTIKAILTFIKKLIYFQWK